MNNTDVFTIAIRKRPWWFWALAGLWLLLEALLLQTTVASVREGEDRAATICSIAVTVVAAFGGVAWFNRGQDRKRGESSGQHQEASTSEPTSTSTVA
jgi:hypothetical protein